MPTDAKVEVVLGLTDGTKIISVENLTDVTPFLEQHKEFVKVVRCKDCKWYSLGECENDNMWDMFEGDLSRVYCMRPKSNFYCGYGERREDG